MTGLNTLFDKSSTARETVIICQNLTVQIYYREGLRNLETFLNVKYVKYYDTAVEIASIDGSGLFIPWDRIARITYVKVGDVSITAR